jgi:hypothetical protein
MQQVRRLSVIVGLGLVLVGVATLLPPGPFWLAVLLGLGMLAAEFLWACWVRKGAELIDSAFGTGDFSKLDVSRERERTWGRLSRRRRARGLHQGARLKLAASALCRITACHRPVISKRIS